MKNFKRNLTITIFILILTGISAFLYLNNMSNTDTINENQLNNDELFIEKIDIDFNSLQQEDE